MKMKSFVFAVFHYIKNREIMTKENNSGWTARAALKQLLWSILCL